MRSIITILLALLLIGAGCEINQKEVKPEDGFLKIYNHPDELLTYYPESVIELPGGGYLFISAVKDETSEIEYPNTYLVRTDAAGVVQWSNTYDWLAPAANLFLSGSTAGFVAMDAQLNAFAVLVDPSSGEISATHDLDMTVPLYAYPDKQGSLVVLGYDFVSRSSWVSKFSSSFSLERSNLLPVNTDMELMIQRHLNKTGEQFPFFIGEYSTDEGTGYYVSCFQNYALLTVFLDVSSLNVTGNVFSYQTREAISAVIHKTGSAFGITGYYEENNYVVPEADLVVSTSQNIKDFDSEQLYELSQKAPVVTSRLEADGEAYILFASQTNDNAVVIYQYAMENDSLTGTHYRYLDQRVEVADMIQTSDEGVALLAGTYILGKYRRPALIKEPKEIFFPEEE